MTRPAWFGCSAAAPSGVLRPTPPQSEKITATSPYSEKTIVRHWGRWATAWTAHELAESSGGKITYVNRHARFPLYPPEQGVTAMSTKRPDSLEDFQRKQASKRAADDDLHYGSWGSAELATLETGRKAVSDFNKTIYRWFEIGEAIEIIRQKAERMNDRFAFKRIMRQQGFSMEKEDKVIDKSMVTKLKQVCDRKTEVIAWHETLTSKQKREWAAPNTVMKQFWTRDAQDRRINWNGQRIDPKGNVLDDNGQVVEKSPTQAEVD